MLQKVMNKLDRRTRGVAMTVGGMGALLTGSKASALGMFTQGVRDIEAEWRAAHPDFQGGFDLPLERSYYEIPVAEHVSNDGVIIEPHTQVVEVVE